MTKLRLQFLAFFILLQLGVIFLLGNSYRQMRIEEKSLWEGESAKVYNQMQAQISDFLNLEDARSFKDYRFSQSKEGEAFTTRSPLSEISPVGLPKGWLGYFQVEPDGGFSTPYLPPENPKSLSDYSERFRKQTELEKSTLRFRKEMQGALAERVSPKDVSIPHLKPPPAPAKVFDAKEKAKSAPNVYPNPIAEKKQEAKSGEMESPKMAAPAADYSSQLGRREETVQEGSIQNFRQTQSSASSAAGPTLKKSRAAPLKESSQRPIEPVPAGAPKPSSFAQSSELNKTTSIVWLDPFQAKVSGQFLIFFRRVSVDQKMYLQGFVLETQKFFEALMQNSFENSELPKFSWVRWVWEDELIAQYGQVQSASNKQNTLFWRWMAYPLNSIRWKVVGEAWPQVSTRLYLNILSAGLFLFSTLGLFWIYRSSAAQIRLSQKRQDFVAAVSHELKTPLTSIRMYSEMLEDDWVKDEAKKKEYYQNIHQESERLSRLIENVLQMARLEKQNHPVHLIKQNPEADLKHWALQFETLAQKEGFEFVLKLPDSLPSIEYDPDALKEIFLIFMENSIKFSKNASKKLLELIVKVDGSFLNFVWRDYGPGVPEAELRKIFEKFYRIENELTRKTKGTGIGLAIAKMTMESMRASIEAKNREEGLDILLKFPIS